jgi:hypothetical protein
MLGATLIAIFFIPLFFVLFETLSTKLFGGKSSPSSSGKKSGGGAAPAATPHARREGD